MAPHLTPSDKLVLFGIPAGIGVDPGLLDEPLRDILRDLLKRGLVEWNEKTGRVDRPKHTQAKAVTLRDLIFADLELAPSPAAGVAVVVKYIWGYDRPNWPLYGKFANLFKGDNRFLASFFVEHAADIFEKDPIPELFPLAHVRTGTRSKEQIAAERKAAEDNANELRRMRLVEWDQLDAKFGGPIGVAAQLSITDYDKYLKDKAWRANGGR